MPIAISQVDSLFVHMPYLIRHAGSCIQTVGITQQAQQRAGRAGREGPGKDVKFIYSTMKT